MNEGLVMGERAGYFSVGSVFGRTFGLFGEEIGKYLLLGALLMSPSLIYALFFAPLLAPVKPVGIFANFRNGLVSSQIDGLLQTVLLAVVLYGAFQQMQGRGFDLGESLKVGFGRIFGVLVVSILTGLAVGIGLILLVVPGLMMLCAFYVSVPVCVIERPGIFASLSRSGELTKGVRWQIFGLVLIMFLVKAVIGAAIGLIVPRIGGDQAVAVATFFWHAAVGPFGAVMAAVVYHDLRVSREGVDAGQIASVFD